jgi:hypothetical protein
LLPFVRYFWHDAKVIILVRKSEKLEVRKKLQEVQNKKDAGYRVFKISFFKSPR